MFEPETIVADALEMHPKARWVFAAYHLGGCNSCDRAYDETLQDLADGIRHGHADAVLAASIFHYGQHTVGEAKRFMAAQGIPMRLA